jgi:hypothetical protein
MPAGDFLVRAAGTQAGMPVLPKSGLAEEGVEIG